MTSRSENHGTRSIGLNMPIEMAEEIERRASSMQITVSKYCKIILKDWLDSGQKLRLEG